MAGGSIYRELVHDDELLEPELMKDLEQHSQWVHYEPVGQQQYVAGFAC